MRALTDRHACDFPVGWRVDQTDVVVVGVEYDQDFGGDRSRAVEEERGQAEETTRVHG